MSLLLGSCGAVAAFLVWQLIVPLIPPDAAASSMAVRLGTATAALLPGSFVLATMIAAQMAVRFAAGVLDPTAGRETRFLLVNQRVISNTVEQTCLFVPALLALAAGMPGAQLPAALALGPVFAAARLAFWVGYVLAPVARAPGMAATYAVNAATLLAAAWMWLN
ncbi:MAPEG family protein [Limobrevibacterium gyesilva]|uniref:MAPEG family protein n=1 Tax=Limobrevibacterium gyesilva TaxID=2991712 RepID=A0AA41YSR6_9PROT|nr:MAPEG family protein [Limobrevibacterium gyesilva]MCW3475898.1 MAPEG family protein [Limobrevibacterium gyesilva]